MIDLPKEERLRLLKFVCSFAWTDLRITDGERALIRRLASDADLDAGEQAQVDAWLQVPPRAEEVDPLMIPHEHRERFLRRAREVCEADGQVAPVEREALQTFAELLASQ